ncbi:MAG: oligoribonuclease, partial [Bifidobacterium crudilactis]|nr:oligoribonuclease [Bifidobacterium crudilactis]
KHGGHRALADIIESIDELRYYREAFFAPTPGPDDQKSKDIAAQVESTSLLRSYEAEGAPVEDASTPEKIDY